MSKGDNSTDFAWLGRRVLSAISALVLLASLFVSDGFLSVDEFVYFLGAESFAKGFSLVFDNGMDEFNSPDLVFLDLVSGPNGLVSQYPVGSSVLGAPFVSLFGARGLFF